MNMMMTVLALALSLPVHAAPPFQVGQTTRAIVPPAVRDWRAAQTQALITQIWYPTAAGQTAQANDIGPPGRAVFIGHPLVAGAAVAAGRHPLIMLSHGTGGSAPSLDWLAAALAARGYVVAGVNHPGNNALEALTREGFERPWERATDIGNALDAVLADPQFAPHIDAARIGAAGFSLGGYTVLALAGARTDMRAFAAFCASPEADAICTPPEAAALAIIPRSASINSSDGDGSAASERASAASLRDARIGAVFALAPALGQAFDGPSLRAVRIPVALVSGDGDTTVPLATNHVHIARLLGHARSTIMPGGVSHYTFLAPCTPAAQRMLADLCTDAPGVDRSAVHARTVELAASFFGQALGTGSVLAGQQRMP